MHAIKLTRFAACQKTQTANEGTLTVSTGFMGQKTHIQRSQSDNMLTI